MTKLPHVSMKLISYSAKIIAILLQLQRYQIKAKMFSTHRSITKKSYKNIELYACNETQTLCNQRKRKKEESVPLRRLGGGSWGLPP